MNIFDHVKIVLDEEMSNRFLPNEIINRLQEEAGISVSTSHMGDLMKTILELLETTHVLVVSDHAELRKMLLAMNPLSAYKIATYDGKGTYHTTDVETAILRREHSFYTADGVAYYPEKSMGHEVYVDDTGRMFAASPCHTITGDGDAILYDYQGNVAGHLFPEALTEETCIGWFSDCLDALCTETKSHICSTLLHATAPEAHVPMADHILLFEQHTTGEVAAIAMHEKNETDGMTTPFALIWEVFTGTRLSSCEDDVRTAIVESSLSPDVPSILLEDAVILHYAHFYQTAFKECTERDLLENTLARIAMHA